MPTVSVHLHSSINRMDFLLVTESFRDFCKSEILTGENLYDAGNVHGLQEAEKGVKFQKFPPVLCLHLLRFEYDYNLSQHRKINDSYSFDCHLDLSEFLEKPDCSWCSYKLLSILVHSGDNSSGHYVSFINPALDGQVRSECPKDSHLIVDL